MIVAKATPRRRYLIEANLPPLFECDNPRLCKLPPSLPGTAACTAKSYTTRLRLVGFGLGPPSAMPDRTTGARSGNSATSERFPPPQPCGPQMDRSRRVRE